MCIIKLNKSRKIGEYIMGKIEIELSTRRIVIMNKGETFKELLDKIHCQELVALCELSGDYYELCTEIPCSGKVNIVNAESEIGIKTYSRTLQYIFINELSLV